MPLSRTCTRAMPSSTALGLDHDARHGARGDVLEGVADQVVEHLAHQHPVGPDVDQVTGDDLAAAVRPVAGRDDVLDQVGQRHRLALQGLVARDRVGEQVGDEAAHLPDADRGCAATIGAADRRVGLVALASVSSRASAQPSMTLSGLFRSWATVPAKLTRDSR